FPFPEPPTSASVDRNFFCTNDAGNITLTAVGGSGDVLEWYENSCGGTSIASGPVVSIASPTVTTTYYARWENACGATICASVTVTVVPLPIAPTLITVDQNPICEGTAYIKLAAVGGSGEILKWYSGSCGGILVGTGTPLTIAAPTVATTYFARWESVCGASTCASIDITVTPLPQPVTSATASISTICFNDPNPITLTAVGGSGTTLKWAKGSCLGEIVGIGPIVLIDPPTITTTYYAFWENSCDTSACVSVTITVTPAPVAPISISSSNNLFCQGSVANITLTAVGGSGDLVRWFRGYCGSTDMIGTGTSITIPSPATTTAYYARWENACGVTACAYTTVTVYPIPTVFFTGLNASYCINNPAVLITGNMQPNGYFGGNGIINNGNGTAWFNPVIAGLGTHTVTYTFTSPQGCTVTSTQNVTVNPLPFVSFVGLATKYCVNSAAVTLTGNMAPAGTFTGPGITGNTFDPALAGVGTHIITYTYDDLNTCSNSVSKTTTVYPLPIVDFAGLLPQYCVNNPPVVLTGNQGPNGFFSGLGVTNIGPGQAIFDPAFAGVGGPYTVIFQFTDPTTGCTNSKTKTVSVVALPTASFTGLDLEYCFNGPQDTLWGNMAPAGTFSGPGIINNGNGTAFFRPSVAGIGGPHTITYTFTDPNGCFASSQMTTIVRPVPTVNFTGLNTQYCISVNPVTLTGNMAPFGIFSGPGITDNANGTATFDPAAAGTGTHSIIYTAANTFGCSNSITKTVTVNPLPVVSFTGLAATYCINSPFAVLTGNKVPFGSFTGPGIQDLGNGKARFYPNLAGIGGPYDITYTYLDANACQNSATNTTTVIDLPVVSVSGLEPSYCINAAPDTITGNFAPMGEFTGPGITDLNIGKAIFNPATAGVGGPYIIKYTYADLNGCTNFITYEVMVTALPVVTFNTLASSYCVNGNPVILVGSHKPFGTFTTTAAAGLTDYGNGTGLFTPSVAGVGGPYSITYEYTDLNGCSASQTQSTSVIPTAVKPDTIQTSANNFCTGTVPNITLTAIGGSGTTVRWFKGSCGGTLLGTGTSITVPSPADTTQYFARWENSCGVSECTMLQINIVHYAIAAAAVSVDQTNFCSGTVDSISLSAVGGFGQVFKWFKNSCGGTLVGSGNPLKIPAPLVTTTYYGRWETGCGASACKPITVTVKPQPVIADSVSVNHNNFCQGAFNNIILTANGGSGQTFEWYTSSCGGNIIGSGTTLILPAPDTTTIYYGRWLNTCDTTDCKTIQVNVFPVTIKPDSISADNNNYCSGTVGIVNLTAFGGLGTTLEWFENTCSGTPIGTGTPLMINAPTATTTFFARWVNPCGASECTSFTLNVIPQPVKPDSLTVDTNYFCQSYNGIIILNGFGGVGDTLKWYTDACNGTYVGKGTELRIPAPDTTTWYFAKWTNICGESTCDSIHVIVNEPMPLDSIYADTTLVCYNYNQPITLTAVGGHGDEIKWFKGSCGSTPIGTGTSIQIMVPPATTTYFARMENYCGTTPCDSVTITVIPLPTKPTLIEADTNFFCPGTVANITLTAIGGYGDTISGLGETLRWFLGSCGGMEIGTGTTITIPAPVVSTRYYARWENSCGVSACNEIQIVIDIPRPVTAAWADTNNFCPGAVEDITLMSSGGYGQLLGWYSKDLLSGTFNLITYGQPVNLFAPDTTTTYYVRWENNCGVSAWDSVVVIVNIPLIPSLITVDTNGFCSDYNMPITLSAIEGRGDTLRWFTGACDGTEIGTGNPLIIMAPTETTTYYARWENICGVSDCQSLLVSVVPAPELSAGGVDSVCEAAPYQVSKAWANNYTSVLWTSTGTGTFDDATLVNPLYTLGPENITARDSVFLIMTVLGNSPCGPYTDSLLLVINPLPDITFIPGDTAICKDSAVIIQASGAYTYQWSPATGLSNTSGGAVVASPASTTEYTIIGTSSSGCVDSTKYNVRVLPTPVVNLGEDLYLFTCEPITLDAGKGTGSENYEWEDGSQRRYRKVEENGTYWVTVR
ncbi:MAG: hypothetical protein Q7J34_04300, partial [Bacteroidales bacterium]|nr:hypothetical protein [Bacteroidales bacterium]